ncbi:MAG: carboxypeptidase regulatory-like domain-containing protein [Bryobacterales bacterium]|nr:carboxypeptidase regulatory-like domain-containing protein [Bryobacterales bacterium]
MKNTMFRVIAAAILVAAVDTAHGQVLYGSLVGNVSDTSAAAVSGVEVQATNVSTNQSRTVLTNGEGGYNLPNLAAGAYTLTFMKAGFRPVRKTELLVSINTITRSDVQLEVGAVTESVTVSTDSAALQTDRAEVRAEITSKTLVNVPVAPGRNCQGLFGLLPGFTPPNQSASVPGNPSRAMGFSVNGTNGQSNNTRIDGASSTNVWRPSFVAYVPALESIETVNVVTNSFDAEQGLAGGAAISVQIKSGTNALHGSAFEYYNGNATKAKPFFLPVTERKPKDVYNQFGATVGGPIIKDKLFYFTSYEGTFNHRFASALGSVPTPAMRAGDLSGAASDRPIYDPFSGSTDGSGRTSFPGGLIPHSRMPDAVRKILPLWPTPTGPGTQNNYYAAGRFTLDRQRLTPR